MSNGAPLTVQLLDGNYVVSVTYSVIVDSNIKCVATTSFADGTTSGASDNAQQSQQQLNRNAAIFSRRTSNR